MRTDPIDKTTEAIAKDAAQKERDIHDVVDEVSQDGRQAITLTEQVHKSFRDHSISEAFKHMLFACVMGIIGAGASILLSVCVDAAFKLFQAHTWLIWGMPLLGVASLALYKVFKLPLGLTTHQVMVQMRQDKPVSKFLAPGILLGTCASMLGGGSVGKEAAALQMGASLGSFVSRPFHLRSVYKKNVGESMEGYAAATGMAATFSALFFAPLGCAVLVMELARFKRSINKHIVSILLACFIAFAIASFFGIGDVIDRVEIPTASWPVVGQCLVIGVSATLVGALYASATDWVHDLTWRIAKNYWVWVIVGGLLFAVIVTFCGWMPFTGSGGNTLSAVLHGQYADGDFAIKALLTVICLGFWFKGGEIMPSFCVGGLLGAATTIMTGGDAPFGAAVGSITLFAAFSGCPLGAFLMGCEIFGWEAAPWLAIAVAVSAVMNPSVGMYGAGLDDAVRGRWRNVLQGSYHRIIEEEKTEATEKGVQDPGLVEDAQNVYDAVDDAIKQAAQTNPKK